MTNYLDGESFSTSRGKLLDNPHLRFSMSVIIEIAYGHKIRSSDDWYLGVARDASLALFETGTPGSTLIDAFPARE